MHRRAEIDPENPSVELLVWAYERGAFPMVDPESGRIGWYSPDPRAVLPLDGLRVSRSLRRVVRAGVFEMRTDTAFEAVMRECAEPRPGREQTWIDERLIELYTELHRSGRAHSLEAWRDGALVGGLYGVHLGAAFFGESMFSRPERGGTDASKVAFVHLVALLRQKGFVLLDTQFATAHLERFGVIEIPRAHYLEALAPALRVRAIWPAPGALPPIESP
jgi:leucyl/phenylalanyl-tRNA--protein transferase